MIKSESRNDDVGTRIANIAVILRERSDRRIQNTRHLSFRFSRFGYFALRAQYDDKFGLLRQSCGLPLNDNKKDRFA